MAVVCVSVAEHLQNDDKAQNEGMVISLFDSDPVAVFVQADCRPRSGHLHAQK